MRNFEERKAEIFRRSDERIKERKRTRKRLFLCFLPVFICFTLYLMFLPAIMSTKETAPEEKVTEDNNGIFGRYVFAEVRDMNDDTGYYQAISDQNIVADIVNIIQFFDNQNDEASYESGVIPKEETSKSGSQADTSSNTIGYTIVLTSSDGSKMIYKLVGNSLINEGTQQEHLLTDDQYIKLKTVLGLSE